jgi:HlyD family secretion protein
MKPFPPEIIENSVELHYCKFSKTHNCIYLLVILLLIVAFCLLPFIKISVNAQSSAIVRSDIENIVLQSSVGGEIIYSRLTENTKIKQGDTLLLISSGGITEQLKFYRDQIQLNNLFLQDLHTLLSGNPEPLKTVRYVRERENFLSKINEYHTRLEKIEKDYVIAKELFNRAHIAEIEYFKSKNNLDVAQKELESYKQQMNVDWQQKKTTLEFQNDEYTTNIARLEDELTHYTILAPVDGTIHQAVGIKKNSMIYSSQFIGFISPESELIIECYVLPADIGYIRNNQQVKFQFHAFNYLEWGGITGKVIEISEDAYIENSSVFYKVKCSLDRDFLELKNGYKGYLKKGMTCTALFLLTERSLWNLLFDKIDNWMNPDRIIIQPSNEV